MITPIYIKKFDRRTHLFIAKSVENIDLEIIKKVLSEFFLKCTITQGEGTEFSCYKISFRLTENEKRMVLNQLYKIAGINYEEIKIKNREIVKNRPKKKKIVDESIITGFSGNLFLNDLKFHYKVIN